MHPLKSWQTILNWDYWFKCEVGCFTERPKTCCTSNPRCIPKNLLQTIFTFMKNGQAERSNSKWRGPWFYLHSTEITNSASHFCKDMQLWVNLKHVWIGTLCRSIMSNISIMKEKKTCLSCIIWCICVQVCAVLWKHRCLAGGGEVM